MVFASGQSKTPKLKYIRTCLGKHSIECGLNFQTINQTTFPSSSNPTISKGTPCSFHNLVDLVMKNKDGVRSTIIPSKVLLQLQNLERVKIVSCSGLKVVFPLSSKAKNISGLSVSQTVVKIPNLREVYLEWLDDLRYVWNNHQWMTLEFPNLTSLSIYVCNSLNYVFTSSMVGSLVQLQDLVISDCMNIEVIVSEVQRCDDNVNEIMLPRLKSITLCKLPRLSGFYLGKVAFSLTSLDTLEIEECPSFEVFTRGHLATPELKVMDTSFGMYYVHGDLNSFAKTRRF
ncbi:hypothetical protein QVD17_18284 [Tagetes erecta]|uniref:Disease resistance protein At4g27190-like leucine-rich repeats domain-containing protein n=1 Tax=Tagetes erecta TaxID=13708 RepID=A0AAD8KKB6_TARER|nr:hypothetical protein QVD17_18284 [Tagetes erecta]